MQVMNLSIQYMCHEIELYRKIRWNCFDKKQPNNLTKEDHKTELDKLLDQVFKWLS